MPPPLKNTGLPRPAGGAGFLLIGILHDVVTRPGVVNDAALRASQLLRRQTASAHAAHEGAQDADVAATDDRPFGRFIVVEAREELEQLAGRDPAAVGIVLFGLSIRERRRRSSCRSWRAALRHRWCNWAPRRPRRRRIRRGRRARPARRRGVSCHGTYAATSRAQSSERLGTRHRRRGPGYAVRAVHARRFCDRRRSSCSSARAFATSRLRRRRPAGHQSRTDALLPGRQARNESWPGAAACSCASPSSPTSVTCSPIRSAPRSRSASDAFTSEY